MKENNFKCYADFSSHIGTTNLFSNKLSDSKLLLKVNLERILVVIKLKKKYVFYYGILYKDFIVSEI